MKNVLFKKYLFLALILFGVLFFAKSSYAADLYVTPSGAGSANGSNWSNALPWTFTPARGNTYYLAGGSYSSGKTLSTSPSNTTTITLRKATTSNSGGVTGWSSDYNNTVVISGTINIQSSYWIIDGVSEYGIKVIGTNGPNKGSIILWSGYTHNNISIQYLELTSGQVPILNQCLDGTPTCPNYSIYSWNSNNIIFTHNYVHDIHDPLQFNAVSATSDSIEISNNTIERNYYETAGLGDPIEHHSGGIIFFGISGTFTNQTIKFNKFIDIIGTSVIDIINSPTISMDMYDNIIYYTTNTLKTGTGNGWYSCANDATCTNINLYNNTIVNSPYISPGTSSRVGALSSVAPSNWNVKNNLWFCNFANCAAASNTVNAQITYNDNWYGGVAYNGTEAGAINGGSENPFTNSSIYDFTLKTGSTPIDSGTDLGSSYNIDYAGIIRPKGSAWDIGAYEYVGAAPLPDTTPPSPPTNVTVN